MSSTLDLATLASWYEEHRPRLLAMVQRRINPVLGPRLDAEDILSEAYLTAHARCSRGEQWPNISPYSWLCRIVRDRLLDAYRSAFCHCRDARRELPWPERSSMQLALGLIGTGEPDAEALAADLRERVAATLRRLGPRDQEILWMRHYDQLTFREAAEVLGITENAATVRYVRALQRLRDLWQQLFETEGDQR